MTTTASHVSNYSAKELSKLHTENFRAICAKYPKGHCVGFNWTLHVTNDRVALVTPYQIKNADGTWSGINESRYIL